MVAVAFSGELSTVLQAMRDFESLHHIGLLPGFTIAALTLLSSLQGKRRQLQRRAAADAAEVHKAQDRAQRLERLVTFWRALTESSDLESATVIARADQALYRAKREGRDLVCLAIDEPAPALSHASGDEPGR